MLGSGLDVSKKKESAATTNCCQVNAVYGLPRFEIESVHALCFRSGTHILPTTMMFFWRNAGDGDEDYGDEDYGDDDDKQNTSTDFTAILALPEAKAKTCLSVGNI